MIIVNICTDFKLKCLFKLVGSARRKRHRSQQSIDLSQVVDVADSEPLELIENQRAKRCRRTWPVDEHPSQHWNSRFSLVFYLRQPCFALWVTMRILLKVVNWWETFFPGSFHVLIHVPCFVTNYVFQLSITSWSFLDGAECAWF